MWTEDGVTEKERTHCMNFHCEIITLSPSHNSFVELIMAFYYTRWAISNDPKHILKKHIIHVHGDTLKNLKLWHGSKRQYFSNYRLSFKDNIYIWAHDWHFSTGALKILVNAFHCIDHTEKLKKVTVIVIIIYLSYSTKLMYLRLIHWDIFLGFSNFLMPWTQKYDYHHAKIWKAI